MKIETVLTHTLVPELLEGARVVLDCGSNTGAFAHWLSDHTNAAVHGFEPDPRLFKKLPVLPRVQYHELAVDGSSGAFDLALGESICSSGVYREAPNQPTVRVRKTSLDDFCRTRGIEEIDFIKLDIEGAELAVLSQISESLLRKTKQITVEFHDFLRIEDVPKIRLIFQRLAGIGFYGMRVSHFTWGDCLFMNEGYFPLSFADKCSIHLRGRLLPGLKRFIRRKVGA